MLPTGEKSMVSSIFLTAEERLRLESYLDHCEQEDAYRARIRLLLLYDQGTEPEQAASQVGVTIHRARSFIRAFNRERLGLFPATLFATQSEEDA
jgi:hypothetical protein